LSQAESSINTEDSIEPSANRALFSRVFYGLILGFAFLFSVIFLKQVYVGVAGLAAAFGAMELAAALRIKGWYIARPVLFVGAIAIMPITYIWGSFGQWLACLALVAALVLWRLAHLIYERRHKTRSLQDAIFDFAAAAFVVIYVPLMTSFSVLMLREKDGAPWVIACVVTVVCIDTFGFLIGRKLGKHKIAPGVSPKKSLEGLIASIVFGCISAVLFMTLLLHGSVLQGFMLAGLLLFTAVFGDLAESLIKRDLGIKDMSKVLPGHGGVMDRLDSMLPSMLITYLFWFLIFKLA
jgi:phosphatidate cytidylyltransferase